MHFDSFLFCKELQNKISLKPSQSKAIAATLNQILHDKIASQTSCAITKADYESYIFLHRIDLTQLKADVQQSQARETFSALLAQEQLSKDLNSGKQKIREKLLSLRSEGRLEMTLEKGRMRDAFLGAQLNYQDVHSKIDTETSNGFAATEKLRHELFYSLTGIDCLLSYRLFSIWCGRASRVSSLLFCVKMGAVQD